MRATVLRLKQRLLGLIARGVVKLANDGEAAEEDEAEDAAKPVQLLQVSMLAGEVRNLVQRIQQYGLTSVPMPGAYPVLLVCPNGERSQAVAICVDDVRHRPRGGEPGDVVLYDLRGNIIRLRPGDDAPSAVLEIIAAKDLTVNVGGNATITVAGAATIATTGLLNLGGVGGQPVARVGDPVVAGVITAGSAKVKAT